MAVALAIYSRCSFVPLADVLAAVIRPRSVEAYLSFNDVSLWRFGLGTHLGQGTQLGQGAQLGYVFPLASIFSL